MPNYTNDSDTKAPFDTDWRARFAELAEENRALRLGLEEIQGIVAELLQPKIKVEWVKPIQAGDFIGVIGKIGDTIITLPVRSGWLYFNNSPELAIDNPEEIQNALLEYYKEHHK